MSVGVADALVLVKTIATVFDVDRPCATGVVIVTVPVLWDHVTSDMVKMEPFSMTTGVTTLAADALMEGDVLKLYALPDAVPKTSVFYGTIS